MESSQERGKVLWVEGVRGSSIEGVVGCRCYEVVHRRHGGGDFSWAGRKEGNIEGEEGKRDKQCQGCSKEP